MKVSYTRRDLETVYNRIVQCAVKDTKRGKDHTALKKIQTAANFQYNINSIYSDQRIETLMSAISYKLFPVDVDFTPSKGKILFYDYYGISNRGLTQQYLDALYQDKDLEIVYVVENSFTERTENILRMVRSHGSKSYELTQETMIEKIKTLYNIVKKEQPTAIFYHISPWSPVPLVATKPFDSVKKYLVNITDHAFGLGDGNFFDYSFEFREYGCKVSMEKRIYKTNQLKLLPYYPWQEQTEFQGFPIDTTNKVVLFSGSYMYKIENPENTFFNIVSRILKANPNTIMLFAGGGDPTRLQGLIEDNNLSDRFVLLGNRTDISEVFKHIDIYIGTYPHGGGLMSQYAAINGKPILAYKTHVIEKIVCNRKWMDFVFDTEDDLIEEATHLVSDKKYREMRGLMFQSLTATQDDFRQSFNRLFSTSDCLNKDVEEQIDYEAFCQTYIDSINMAKNCGLEHQVLRSCPSALHWKMLLNIFFNARLFR